jgi:hypothetical protein
MKGSVVSTARPNPGSALIEDQKIVNDASRRPAATSQVLVFHRSCRRQGSFAYRLLVEAATIEGFLTGNDRSQGHPVEVEAATIEGFLTVFLVSLLSKRRSALPR